MITNIEDYSYLNTLSDYKITKNAFNNVLVYIEDNNILGFLDYSVMYERAEINYIFVLKEYRGKHIANKLLNHMFNLIGNIEISLEVNENNLSAIKLYQNNGFKAVSRRVGYYNGVDALLMVKEGELWKK